ncbi:NDR1/HIN1-like protein 13 [Juglans microcarpa x Juglans regia]|uniref:NDR1/HIN1-like protein 13 n=1 Tax=Juglans microcarpa x Juglans regia TaxID=2249226 RepID=UPI001B7E0185|nr:NDR1/HIN1-like protein 13 [Juglans microcarpa x Juglans regia]
MAERAPSSDHYHDPPPSEQSHQLSAQPDDRPAFRPGTYVVQVPKDQIYRIPPPENAVIAERYRNPALRNKKKWQCSSCCLWVCISVLLVVLVLGAIVVTFQLVLINPKNPTFDVERVAVKNNSHSRNQLHSNPEYNITLRAKNPNGNVGILYKEGGVASLSFRQREIGTGNYPTFFQDHTDSTVFGIIFHGSNNVVLPTEIEKSMNSQMQKVQVTFSIKMDVPARLGNVGSLNRGSIKFVVACYFTVDTLAKDTHIISRKCHTQR